MPLQSGLVRKSLAGPPVDHYHTVRFAVGVHWHTRRPAHQPTAFMPQGEPAAYENLLLQSVVYLTGTPDQEQLSEGRISRRKSREKMESKQGSFPQRHLSRHHPRRDAVPVMVGPELIFMLWLC